jgi:hypothetical protein
MPGKDSVSAGVGWTPTDVAEPEVVEGSPDGIGKTPVMGRPRRRSLSALKFQPVGGANDGAAGMSFERKCAGDSDCALGERFHETNRLELSGPHPEELGKRSDAGRLEG